MARSSQASRHVAALALALAIGIVAVPDAHRRDEYLQAARVAVDPGHVEVQLSLTPGIAVVDRVLPEIDPNSDGIVDRGEASSYARRVLGSLTLEIDGQPLPLTSTAARFPDVAAIREGEGVISITAVAALPALPAGDHHLHFRNAFRTDVGVYLANALAPADRRVTVIDQQRDVDQRQLTIAYRLDEAMTAGQRLAGLAIIIIGMGLAALLWVAARGRPAPL